MLLAHAPYGRWRRKSYRACAIRRGPEPARPAPWKDLRSPHSHAIIKSIDTSAAEAYPGVHAVVTSADWPETSGRLADLAEGAIQNLGFLSMNVLARGKALYKGHAIAAVAAASPHVAEKALELIKVDYEVLTPVLSADDANET